MPLRFLVSAPLLFTTVVGRANPTAAPTSQTADSVDCPAVHSRSLLGLLVRPITLSQMVSRLEAGCLALDDVRFRPGQDTIASLSPAQFAQLARALGMARGVYRVSVAPESTPGWPPDTLQARRRGTRLRDELMHYGASMDRLVDLPGWPLPPVAVSVGAAVPMLVRVPES